MTAKQYLQQIYRLQVKIRHRQEQLVTLKASASGFRAIDYSADKIQSSPSDRMADVVGKYADLEAEINRLIDEYIFKQNYIIKQIEGIQNAQLADILYARYILCEPLTKIANDLHYDYKYCCRLHGRALREFAQLYLNDSKSDEQRRF